MAPRSSEVVRLAHVDDIPPGRGLRVSAGERQIGLYRVGNELYAMDDCCPHAGYPLSDGLFEDGVVTCAAHHWQFDVRTGLPPGSGGGLALPCFPVSVVNDEVWVELPGEED